MRIIQSIQSRLTRCILLIILSFGLGNLVVYAEINSDSTEVNSEELNVGELIFGHVLDAHDWHILTWKGHHVSIPLPVILYNSEKGLDVFMSNQFHHGHSSYKGYKLEHGNIVSEDGATFFDLSITKTVTAIIISILLLLY